MLSDTERKRSQRERTAASRARRKEQSANDVAANEQKRKDDFDAWRTRSRLIMPGECAPFIDAGTVPEALLVAREFLVALNQPEVQPGETLLDVERRAVSAWCAAGAGLLNRNTLRIDASTGSTTDGFTFDFDSRWIPLDGANELIDVSTLQAIEIPVEVTAVVDSPTVEVPARAITDDPAFKNYRTPEVLAICKAQQDRCDAEARKISARNLERELAKEKRLGVAYAYAE